MKCSIQQAKCIHQQHASKILTYKPIALRKALGLGYANACLGQSIRAINAAGFQKKIRTKNLVSGKMLFIVCRPQRHILKCAVDLAYPGVDGYIIKKRLHLMK